MTHDAGDPPTPGAFIRARRRALGLSQTALAVEARISRTAGRGLETGRARRPRSATPGRRAAALRVSPGTLERLPRDGGG